MSWKPEVLVSDKWSCNALVFATREEAEQNARDLLMRWFVPTDSRAVESSDPVNYRYANDKLETVESPYNPEAVDKAIASSNRHGRPIGAAEARAIHRLLKGRH